MGKKGARRAPPDWRAKGSDRPQKRREAEKKPENPETRRGNGGGAARRRRLSAKRQPSAPRARKACRRGTGRAKKRLAKARRAAPCHAEEAKMSQAPSPKTPEEWARQCAARRAQEPREWSVAAQSAGRVDELSGAEVENGLRRQPEPVELSGREGRLTLTGQEALRVRTLAIEGPFAAGVAMGSQSVKSDHAFIEIEADDALLERIELTVDEHGQARARFSREAAWSGPPPKLSACLPFLRELVELDGARAGVGAFGPEAGLALSVAGHSRAQLSLPAGGSLRSLSVTASGEAKFWASSPDGQTRWAADEGTVVALGRAKADLSGIAFDRLRASARGASAIENGWAEQVQRSSSGLARVEGAGPGGPWIQAPKTEAEPPSGQPRKSAMAI
jgi:hypothetical protein